ncbi:hypothetical protein [Rhodopila sp.]|uniref:hypothetical protein n=1 Tax=Rhodopila sp. TaxID=2480087 RepID=UPI003D14F27C
MSATTTEPRPTSSLDFQPGDILLQLIVTLLAPMFLAVCRGNLDFARIAALQTVDAYRARSHVDLIAVAQIVAHGLASVSAACLSMADDISLAMTLRLRASANASDRACDRARRALQNTRASPAADPVFAPAPTRDLTPDPEADRKDAEVIARLAAVRQQGEALLARHAAARPAAPAPAAPSPAAIADPAPTPTAPPPAAIAAQAPTPVAAAAQAPTSAAAAPTPAIPTPAIPTPAIPTPATSADPATPVAKTPRQTTPTPAVPAVPATPTPATADAEPSAEEFQQLWGAAMTVVANEYSASMADLPPAERDAARARADVLTKAAADLFSGNVPPRLRSGDLGTAIPPNR